MGSTLLKTFEKFIVSVLIVSLSWIEKRLAVAEENLPTYWATPKAPALIVRTLGYWAKVYVRSCACRPCVVQVYTSAYCGGHMYSVSTSIWGTSIILNYYFCVCVFFVVVVVVVFVFCCCCLLLCTSYIVESACIQW